MFKIMIIMIFTMGLLACSEPQSNTDQSNINDDDQPQTHLLSDQQKMLQKAKDTEKLIHEADEKRRKALEDQGGWYKRVQEIGFFVHV